MLGTQRTEPHRTRDALHRRSPEVLAEDAVPQRCRSIPRAPGPQQQPFPTCWAVPSSATATGFPPQLSGSKHPPEQLAAPARGCGGGSCVPLAGAPPGFFIFDYCVSWPTVRWGQGQENELVQGAQPNPLPSPAASQQRERRGDGGPVQLALTTWQRAKLFHSVARHILYRGVLLLTLLFASPQAVFLAAGSTFIF